MTLSENAKPLLAVLFLAVILSSCDMGQQPENACPAVQGTPDSAGAGIVGWGGESAKVTAQIASVAVECIPMLEPAIDTSKAKRGAYNVYQIAVTATVNYQIKVDRLPDTEADIIFEAVSPSGVVLGSARSRFRMVENGSAGTASARITSLTDSEIRRVVAVRAKWDYSAIP
jgi:hypothetical protein